MQLKLALALLDSLRLPSILKFPRCISLCLRASFCTASLRLKEHRNNRGLPNESNFRQGMRNPIRIKRTARVGVDVNGDGLRAQDQIRAHRVVLQSKERFLEVLGSITRICLSAVSKGMDSCLQLVLSARDSVLSIAYSNTSSNRFGLVWSGALEGL